MSDLLRDENGFVSLNGPVLKPALYSSFYTASFISCFLYVSGVDTYTKSLLIK